MKLAPKHVLFIDANLYLDLYEREQVLILVSMLKKAKGYIFATEQIRDEVYRNRTAVQNRFLSTKIDRIKAERSSLPDFMPHISKNERQIGFTNEAVSSLEGRVADHLRKVNAGEDDVSRCLADIFSSARKATPAQIDRARLRKEFGNPPGKQGDCIGDQINWIQLIDSLGDAKDLWILTKDCDYGLPERKSSTILLNPVLMNDLKRINPQLKVFAYKEFLFGLKEFLKAVEEWKLKTINKMQLALAEEEERFLQLCESSLDRAAYANAASAFHDAQTKYAEVFSEIMKSIGNSLRDAKKPNPNRGSETN